MRFVFGDRSNQMFVNMMVLFAWVFGLMGRLSAEDHELSPEELLKAEAELLGETRQSLLKDDVLAKVTLVLMVHAWFFRVNEIPTIPFIKSS